MTLDIYRKAKLPDSPGVYFFKKDKKILYIGKATSLKDRVRSYFSNDLIETRGSKIVQMILQSNSITYEKTDSVLEALLLEAKLIRKWKPEYNTDGKDDKSYNCILITKEDYPRVLLVRENNLDDFPKEDRLFLIGPFPKGSALKEALQILRKIFPFRDKCVPNSGKKCFNAQIGLCPSVCDGQMTKIEYRKLINKLILFLKGDKKKLLNKLSIEMNAYAKMEEFEKAKITRNQIYSIHHINDVTLLKRATEHSKQNGIRIEAYDVAHLQGGSMVGAMVVIVNGVPEKKEYRSFNIKTVSKSNDPKALREILERRFKHIEWGLPEIIVVDGNKVQLNVAESVLKKANLNLGIVSVVKDEHHKAREIISNNSVDVENIKDEIILANSEAHRFSLKLHKLKRGKKFLGR